MMTDSQTLKTYTYTELSELPALARELKTALQHNLILFIGDLGAGKTTFIKELVQQYGSTDLASSPSYALINKYNADKTIYHIDLYRLDRVEDVFHLGIEEILYGDNLCLIEWPQIIIDHIDPPYHILKIEVQESGERKITFSEVSK
jgi:tRNA threonylcarbamoyladenosine biosynthesis protein TsaE